MNLRLALARDARKNLRRLVIADGDDEAPSDSQLRQQGGRRLGAARGHRDGVVGGMLRPSEGAVATRHLDIVEPEASEAFLRGIRQLPHSLDGVNAPRRPSQDGRGVAGSRPDLEDTFIARERERLHGDGNDVRLRYRLTLPDGQRSIFVCEFCEPFGKE